MNSTQRIVSFLPSATEIACALGLSEQLVGITHECDYPPDVLGKPVVVRNALPIETMSQNEVDLAVSSRMSEGQSLYLVDETLLRELAPDLILTQDLCQVCAPSGNEVSQALTLLEKKPEILWLTPKTLQEIATNVRDLGIATGRRDEAERLIASGNERLTKIEAVTKTLEHRPRVFCMEWLDPVYCSGHWVPEMVRIAGGVEGLGQQGSESIRIQWEDVLQWQPEVMIITPCGYDLEKTIEVSGGLSRYPGWSELPAVREAQVMRLMPTRISHGPGQGWWMAPSCWPT